MQKTILDLLELRTSDSSNKNIFEDEVESITFGETHALAQKIGTAVAAYNNPVTPVIVWATKNVRTPALYLGVLYAGCYYVPIGDDTTVARVKMIIESTKASTIVIDGIDETLVDELGFNGKIIKTTDTMNIDNEVLKSRRVHIIDTDPQVIVFTSGSTGTPKGVVINHRATMDLLQSSADVLEIDENEVIGNQAPLCFVGHLRDVFIPLLTGCKTVFFNKALFSTPVKLFELLNEKKISLVRWMAPALTLIHGYNSLENAKLPYVKKVAFGAGAIQTQVLSYWLKYLPEARFFNFYGSTESCSYCIYHEIDRFRDYSKEMPIGQALKNRKIFLLDQDTGTPTLVGEVGEICIGTGIAMGYFNEPEKNAAAFVQNPLNSNYPEIIFRSGDLASVDENGDYYFRGRSSSFVKHMGYRIELGEIEAVASKVEGVSLCVCVYLESKGVICLVHTGTATAQTLAIELRKVLPSYMIPRKFINLETLPRTQNGKVDISEIKKIVS